MDLLEIYNKLKYYYNADRIGPDMLSTHWMLYFNDTMRRLCTKKFEKFGINSEFRPGAYAVFCSRISIGNNVVIRPNSMFFATDNSNIIIEDDVLLGSGIHIYTNNHRFDNPQLPINKQGHTCAKSVVIRKGCWIGANVVILPGVTIGENSVVAASSVVNHSVKSGTLVGGNPIMTIKDLRSN